MGRRAAAESQKCWEWGELGIQSESKARGMDRLGHHAILRDPMVLD